MELAFPAPSLDAQRQETDGTELALTVWHGRQTGEVYSSRSEPGHWSSVHPSLRGWPSLAMRRWSPILPLQGGPGTLRYESYPLMLHLAQVPHRQRTCHLSGCTQETEPGSCPAQGAPSYIKSPALCKVQVQPPPVLASGENPRLPWPVNHFDAFLKPERINPPPRGPARPLGGGRAEKGKMPLVPLGSPRTARMQIITTKITLPHTSVHRPES